ncbi:MAG: zinc ribbon domain-containing protein [Lachnospiraceae bacterium]|nr:zinc ribbon domain-containing protein [Lachnospiraceae bacterium]
MFCTKCGNAVSDTAKFCPVCGTPVDRGIFADEMREIVASPEVPVQAPVQDNTTPVEETVQPVVKPEPEQTVEPTVQAAEPAPQDYRQDVPDITLTAQKWIPEENGLIAPVPDTAEPPRKKGKKALIITLCAVVVVLGLAVGAAFLISGKYSDKVDALEEYQGSALIDNFSEYGELLDRAQNAEGVLHVFDTFSMGDEIDEYLERMDARKKKLPEQALAAHKELDSLGNRYFIETWGAQIAKLGTNIKTAIDNEDYERLVGQIEECKALSVQITEANNSYRQELTEIKSELTDMRSSYTSYALYKDEADEFLENVSEVLSSDNYQDVPYYVNKGKVLIQAIVDANRPYTELNDRKKYYDGLFADVEITDYERYNKIVGKYSDAIVGGSDSSVVSDIVDEYAAFYEETHAANLEEYEALLAKIDRFSGDRLAPDELTDFIAAYSAMKTAESSDKLAEALNKARECEAFVDMYTQKISESEKFLALATGLASEFYFNYGYTGELDEEQMCYICENILSDQMIEDMKATLGWGADPDAAGKDYWQCGFSRPECEELAYYITGQKHYFYKEVSDYAEKAYLPENIGSVRKGDISVEENEDGSVNLDFDIQVFFDGEVYMVHVTETAVYNEDSYFDNYSISAIEMSDYRTVNFCDVYLKALAELYDYEPDHYTEDQFGRHLAFVYVDNDYIPEIYVSSVFGYASAYLISYIDNDNYYITQLASGDGFSEYVPGEGVIRVCDGRQGYYLDNVITLGNDGRTEVVFSGEYSYIDLNSDEMRYDVEIPEVLEDTTSAIYYKYLDDLYTSKGESRYLTGDYTFSEMVQMIEYVGVE